MASRCAAIDVDGDAYRCEVVAISGELQTVPALDTKGEGDISARSQGKNARLSDAFGNRVVSLGSIPKSPFDNVSGLDEPRATVRLPVALSLM